MIVTTTETIEGRQILAYKGIVSSEVIYGANFVRDWMAGLTDTWGGRSGAYQKVFADARNMALTEMREQAQGLGANAIVGVDLDYEVVADKMMMVSANGTAVVVR